MTQRELAMGGLWWPLGKAPVPTPPGTSRVPGLREGSTHSVTQPARLPLQGWPFQEPPTPADHHTPQPVGAPEELGGGHRVRAPGAGLTTPPTAPYGCSPLAHALRADEHGAQHRHTQPRVPRAPGSVRVSENSPCVPGREGKGSARSDGRNGGPRRASSSPYSRGRARAGATGEPTLQEAVQVALGTGCVSPGHSALDGDSRWGTASGLLRGGGSLWLDPGMRRSSNNPEPARPAPVRPPAPLGYRGALDPKEKNVKSLSLGCLHPRGRQDELSVSLGALPVPSHRQTSTSYRQHSSGPPAKVTGSTVSPSGSR